MEDLSAVQKEAFVNYVLQSGIFQDGIGLKEMCTRIANVIFPEMHIQAQASGPKVAPIFLHGGKKHGAEGMNYLKTCMFTSPTPGPVSFGIIGETHRNIIDSVRADNLIRTLNTQKGSCLLAIERGMDGPLYYKTALEIFNRILVKESEIIGQLMDMANERARSALIAAAVFLRIAQGPQTKHDRILIIIGQNHIHDIYTALEYFINDSKIDWVKRRGRVYYTLNSFKD